MDKILLLEKRGCDFFESDRISYLSDVGNYRVGTYDYSIKGKDGKCYILEFGGYDKYIYRKFNKRTGKPLKKAVKELLLENALFLDTQYFNNETGCCYSNVKLEKIIEEMNFTYTIDGILKAVNEISEEQYTMIQFK